MQGIIAFAQPESWLVLLVAIVVSLVAGVVRGFAGFGYSALVVAALTPMVSPGPLVVAVLVLEVIASVGHLRQVAVDVDRAWHQSILIGNALFVPFGMIALASLDPKYLRVIVSGLMLLSAATVRYSMSRTFAATWRVRGTAGAASGILNGLAGSGGVVVALWMAATAVPTAVIRATMMSALLWMSVYTLLCGVAVSLWTARPLVGLEAARWVLVLWPTMIVGIRLGRFAFAAASVQRQRLLVLNSLIAVACAGLAAAVIRLIIWK